MDKNIFSGLEDFGFNDSNNIELFNKEGEKEEQIKQQRAEKEASFLYEKSIICPVCDNSFKTLAVKTSAYRKLKTDSDFFIRYSLVNPYFYDVWICNHCGYASMKADFEKIKSFQIEAVKEKITPKWKYKDYKTPYDENIAIERYKLALLNYTLIEGKSSQKAMTCLKIAWMYRLLNDVDKELLFLNTSLQGFNDAYYNETFPLYGMDKFTAMYLIGELLRRTGNYEDALLWFSNVITTPKVNQKLKELARDGKDFIKEEQRAKKNHDDTSIELDFTPSKDKKGFFSKLFKK